MSPMELLGRLRARWHYWLAVAHRSRGNNTFSLGPYDEAIAELTQAIALDPDLASAHYARGVIYWRELNDYARAVRDFTRALELNPRIANAYLNRGLSRVYGHIGTSEETIADFEHYLALGKDGYWRLEAHNQIQSLKSDR
jgi:tetratricopeptide (TPR) repeat protein